MVVAELSVSGEFHMKRVVGIRFRKADPIKYAEAGEMELRCKTMWWWQRTWGRSSGG